MLKLIFNGIRWWVGISFCLLAIGGFMSGEILLAMIMLTIGLLLIPTISKILFKRKDKAKSNYSIKPAIIKTAELLGKAIKSSQANQLENKVETDRKQPTLKVVFNNTKSQAIGAMQV